MSPSNPHAGQKILRRGAAPAIARLAVLLVHGRGGSASDMLALADELALPDIAWVAPQAAGQTWYPYSFLSPIAQNEPGISSGLGVLKNLVDELGRTGIPPQRVGVLGFSQGACLALEFAARNPQPYAAVVGLSGGLIGPPGTPRDYPGSLDGAAVFLGCSDVDPHIPVERVRESAEVFRRLGAQVDERIYPGMGHIINQDELESVRRLLL
ncbi:MAG: phospholipase/carboxylesterase [Acidobacteriota bacterium]